MYFVDEVTTDFFSFFFFKQYCALVEGHHQICCFGNAITDHYSVVCYMCRGKQSIFLGLVCEKVKHVSAAGVGLGSYLTLLGPD